MEGKNELPLIKYVSEEERKFIEEHFKGDKNGWVLAGEKKYLLPATYANLASDYYNFKVKPSDIWLVSYPKSGELLATELIWLLNNNLNFDTAKSTSQADRCHNFEVQMQLTSRLHESIVGNVEAQSFIATKANAIKKIDTASEPRFIKTHLPLSLVPNVLKSHCKVVYVARNPKDVAVSFYHMLKDTPYYTFNGSFEEFWNYFQIDELLLEPYWDHLKEAWVQRKNPNVLFLFYEEMNLDLLSVTKKVANFLGKTYTDEQYKKLVNHLGSAEFKKSLMLSESQTDNVKKFVEGNFIRSEQSQDWNSMATPELNVKADKWIKDNLKDTDLIFPDA